MTIAYHFCAKTLRDGRPIPADGEWLVHEGEVTICETGLHARVHRMAPGPNRARDRAATYPGIAAAMAEQWGRVSDEAPDVP